ncbi:MAG: hypothetical protein J6X36_06175 [Lachnospiraceae bacterium]|nr:hypothetical protein [Lachnospiraceae bacterium]
MPAVSNGPVASASEETSTETVSSAETENVEEPEPAAVKKAPSAFKAIRMYADFLDDLAKDDEVLRSTLRYDLLYVDNDDIPELVYMEDSAHSSMVHMCLAYEDGVFEVGEFGEYGNFSYLENKGRILSFYMNHGTYLFDFFTLENRTLQEDKCYETVEEQFEGDGTRYYIDGDEVTQEEYDADYAKQYTGRFTGCEYFDAISYADSYDVYSILMEYHKNGHKPANIEMTDTIKAAVGLYGAVSYGVYGVDPANAKEFEEGFANADLTEDGYLSVWYGDGADETLVTDYTMPLTAFRDGSITSYKDTVWYVMTSNDSKDRDYEFHFIDEETIRLVVFDSKRTFGDISYYFVMKKTVEEEGPDD